MQWYTCINVLVTLDANRYTQCADLFLRNHQEKSERFRKIPKLFDVVKGYVGVGWRLWRFIPCEKMHLSQRIQACAEAMVPNTCTEPMVKTNDFDSGEELQFGSSVPSSLSSNSFWGRLKRGGLGCERTCGTPLKIIRWKDLEIISWILNDLWGGGFWKLFPGICT